ncbi:hypothetical protein FZEAL_7953 [Fusarium zealandicum]|uniref:Uncharacterized protein n=1 Tax=Fusarium zealandicum TaxID=1053134 RepID=A0A8H4UF17_9HYPO|nr:hypothetical protein FZEAL_7953 [Fusarium zealandicum]
MADQDSRIRLQARLDRLTWKGDVSVYDDVHLEVDESGLPELVPGPKITISHKSMSRIIQHLESSPFATIYDSGDVVDDLLQRVHYDTESTDCTHAEVWQIIKQAQTDEMEDYEALIALSQDWQDDPEEILSLPIMSGLSLRVCRMLGILAPRDNCSDSLGEAFVDTLACYDFGIHLLVRGVYDLCKQARGMPNQAEAFGKAAGQCLETLINTKQCQKPGNRLDDDVFRTLKERVNEIARGGREPSVGLVD